MKGSHSKSMLRNHVPVERLEMAEVKDDAMPFSDRPFVHTAGFYDLKQRICLQPRARQNCPQAVFKFFVGLLRKHLALVVRPSGRSNCANIKISAFRRPWTTLL